MGRDPGDASAPAPSSPSDARMRVLLQRTFALALAALGIAGVLRASRLAWVCDDSFISIRYAQNLVDGLGLVYNAGERVEGYTNLLWTLLLAAGLGLGAPPVASAEALGIAAYAGLAATLVWAAWRRHREQGVLFLPLAAAAVLVSYDFQEWATGGLETSLFAWLAAAGLLLTRGCRRSGTTALAAGGVLSLLVLTRPDGLLFAALGVLSPWLPPRGDAGRRRQLALLTAGPVALTLAVLVPFKLTYYGELLPTAFYSKSVLRPYYGQGLAYVGLYLAKNWFVPLALGAAALAFLRRRREGLDAADGDDLFLLGAAALFTLYLVHVGGDFMFARRVLPAVPLALLAVEGQLSRIGRPGLQAAVAALLVAAAALPFPVFDAHRVRRAGISDERRFYPPGAIEKRRLQAQVVREALADSGARVAFEGGMCVFGYYSRLPYLVEISGLTQYSLAKLPLPERGDVGHEKIASDRWLRENGIHLVMSHRFPPIELPPGRGPVDRITFGNVALGRIVVYDPDVMDRIAGRPGVRFLPIEQVIARKRREIERGSLETAERALAWLEDYYFRAAGERGAGTEAELRALLDAKRAGPS